MNHLYPACRSCGKSALEPVLSLGRMPLANGLLNSEELELEETSFPIDLVFCTNCTLVQILETVNPEVMFRTYPYFSSVSETVLKHAEQLARRMIETRALDGGSLAVEAASNDGYLLQHYVRAGIKVLGIDPALNVAQAAEEKGVRTLPEFFGRGMANRLRAQGICADIFHAHNVLAHVPDLNGMVEGIRILLKESGVAVIEVPYVKDLIDCREFDTIYHEHVSYFSLRSLASLLERHGLVIGDVEQLKLHGGSLRLFVSPTKSAQPSPAVKSLLDQESAWGMDKVQFYCDFGSRVAELKGELCDLLDRLLRRGKRVAAYGAGAKGAVLLNYCQIGKRRLEFVVDRNTHKQGLFMPGVHLPIFAPSKLLEEKPDYVLLLTWNFADEIMEQQAEYRAMGGRFILPVPQPRIV